MPHTVRTLNPQPLLSLENKLTLRDLIMESSEINYVCPLCGFSINNGDWIGYHIFCKRRLELLIQMKLPNTD